MQHSGLLRAERLTLSVLLCGVAALALSDFVSPLYWGLSVTAAILRLWRGPAFHLSEMQASLIGWAGFVWVAVELLLGRALVVAFTDFLLILALAVVVEAATPRNHLHRMLVGLFLLLAAAVLSDSVLYVLPLLAMLWFFWRASACLYGLRATQGSSFSAADTGLPAVPIHHDLGWMVVAGLLLAVLFIIMPRFDVHALLQPQQPRMQTSGFSDRVELGDFARVLDERVVLRVESLAGSAGQQHFRAAMAGRYWRAVALADFTGHGWQRIPAQPVQQLSAGADAHLQQGVAETAERGQSIALYREASDHAYIPLPDGLLRVDKLPQPAVLDAAGALQFRDAPLRRLRLLMQLGKPVSQPVMQPPLRRESSRNHIPAAVVAWTAELSAGASGRRQALAAVQRELKSWDYDLHVPVDAGRPVASFLQQRRGHCELYATTMVLAARQLGFAARLVNGYYGGEWNDMGAFWLIRQKHAHSWAEVWLDQRWQRMDATPAQRNGLFRVDNMMLKRLWESLRMSWYRYVLSFEDADRGQLWYQLWQYVKALFANVLLILALLLPALLLWRMRARFGRLLQAHWRADSMQQLDRWLLDRGMERQPYQPLRLLDVPPDVDAAAWLQFIRQWEAQCYGGHSPWRRRELQCHLRALLNGC